MLKGPPPHPPGGGLGGRSVPRGVCAAHHAVAAWSLRFVCKPRDGGRGAPARGLRSAGCTPRRPRTHELNRCAARAACGTRSWHGTSGARVAAGQALARAALQAPGRRSGWHVNTASAGTACQASASTSSSSPLSAAKAVMSSRLAFVSSPAFASLARVSRAGCVLVCTALSWSIATCV